MSSVTFETPYCQPSCHPAVTRFKFVLHAVNTIHINSQLSAVRSRMQDGYIYICFPPVSRQPRAFPHDERKFQVPHQSPILAPFQPDHYHSYH